MIMYSIWTEGTVCEDAAFPAVYQKDWTGLPFTSFKEKYAWGRSGQ